MIEIEQKSVQLQKQDWDANNEYATRLHLAVKDNNLRRVQRLIGDGVPVLSVDKVCRTALHWAVVFGYQKVAYALIINTPRSGLDYQDKNGCTPLHYAALGGKTDVGRIILERGALINSIDSKKRTPLHYAAQSGRPDTVEMLISRGANKNCRDYKGFLPCDIAIEWGSFSSLVCLRQNSFLKSDKSSECKDLEHMVCSKFEIEAQRNNSMSENKDLAKDIPSVDKKKSPSLDKLMLAWKTLQNDAKMKREVEAKRIAEAAIMLECNFEHWKEAEQEAKQRKHEGLSSICNSSSAGRSWKYESSDRAIFLQINRSRISQTDKEETTSIGEGLVEISNALQNQSDPFVFPSPPSCYSLSSSPFFKPSTSPLTLDSIKETLSSDLLDPKSRDLTSLSVRSFGSSTPAVELSQAATEQDKNMIDDPKSTVWTPLRPSNLLVPQSSSTSQTTFNPSDPAVSMDGRALREHDMFWWCREKIENFPGIQQSREAASTSLVDNDALRWCTEWDVGIPEISTTRREAPQRSRETLVYRVGCWYS